jgi:DNA replication protein DnaC
MIGEQRDGVMVEIREIADRILQTLPPPAELTPEQQAELDREVERREWLELAQRVGVPRVLWEAHLDVPAGASNGQRTTAAVSRVAEYPAMSRVAEYLRAELPRGNCLVLTGPPGVGKSYAAAAAIRAYRRGRFTYFPALCGALLDPARRAEALDAAKRSTFLVLDDLGVEYSREGSLVAAFLEEIVWHRESDILPTIITTNLTLEQLRGRLSDRIIDRLRGRWGRAFAVGGPSLRAQS